MSSRESILNAVRASQPDYTPLPVMGYPGNKNTGEANLQEKFADALTAIGGKAEIVGTMQDARDYIQKLDKGKRSITVVPILNDLLEPISSGLAHAQSLQDVDYAVIEAGIAVAENGAVWVTEEGLGIRVLPFICQNLIAIIRVENIVPDMHHAYEMIGGREYGFATFIAGPSKTADIEQSLVLGAHGPRSMTVLIIMT